MGGPRKPLTERDHLFWVVGEGLSEQVGLKLSPDGRERPSHRKCGIWTILEGTVCAKALRQERAGGVEI